MVFQKSKTCVFVWSFGANKPFFSSVFFPKGEARGRSFQRLFNGLRFEPGRRNHMLKDGEWGLVSVPQGPDASCFVFFLK